MIPVQSDEFAQSHAGLDRKNYEGSQPTGRRLMRPVGRCMAGRCQEMLKFKLRHPAIAAWGKSGLSYITHDISKALYPPLRDRMPQDDRQEVQFGSDGTC